MPVISKMKIINVVLTIAQDCSFYYKANGSKHHIC